MASSAGRKGALRICSTTGRGMPTASLWKSSTASPRWPALMSALTRAAISTASGGMLLGWTVPDGIDVPD